MSEKLKVRVVTPMRGEMRVEHAMFREMLAITERRFRLELAYSDAQPATHNRNRIALQTLERGADFLLTLDADQAPAGFNPLDYVEHDLDILCFPSPTIRINEDPPIRWLPCPPDGRGLVEVENICGGCLLIARRVLEHPSMRAPFQDIYDANGLRIWGEDQSFGMRAREAGFKVWCALDKPLLHIKPVELTQLWAYLEKARQHGTHEDSRIPA